MFKALIYYSGTPPYDKFSVDPNKTSLLIFLYKITPLIRPVKMLGEAAEC